MNLEELMSGLEEDWAGAVDVGAVTNLMRTKSGGGAFLGSLIKDPRKAQQLVRKLASSKNKAAVRTAGLVAAIQKHEAAAMMDARRAPTTLVNLFFSAVAAGAPSATATVRTPYSNKRWALTSIESFATVDPDPFLLIQLSPGGVDQAVSPTTQAVTWSAGAPQAGIPSGKFNTRNTERTNSANNYRPWARRSRVFTGSDYFNVQSYNAGAAAASLFVLLNVISSPCDGDGFKMESVNPKWFRTALNQFHRTGRR